MTANGPGDGTGITPLRHLAVALKVQYGIDAVNMPSVNELLRMVSKFSGAHSPSLAVDEFDKGRASA